MKPFLKIVSHSGKYLVVCVTCNAEKQLQFCENNFKIKIEYL